MTNSEFSISKLPWSTEATMTNKVGELGSQSMLEIQSPSASKSHNSHSTAPMSPKFTFQNKKSPMTIKDRRTAILQKALSQKDTECQILKKKLKRYKMINRKYQKQIQEYENESNDLERDNLSNTLRRLEEIHRRDKIKHNNIKIQLQEIVDDPLLHSKLRNKISLLIPVLITSDIEMSENCEGGMNNNIINKDFSVIKQSTKMKKFNKRKSPRPNSSDNNSDMPHHRLQRSREGINSLEIFDDEKNNGDHFEQDGSNNNSTTSSRNTTLSIQEFHKHNLILNERKSLLNQQKSKHSKKKSRSKKPLSITNILSKTNKNYSIGENTSYDRNKLIPNRAYKKRSLSNPRKPKINDNTKIKLQKFKNIKNKEKKKARYKRSLSAEDVGYKDNKNNSNERIDNDNNHPNTHLNTPKIGRQDLKIQIIGVNSNNNNNNNNSNNNKIKDKNLIIPNVLLGDNYSTANGFAYTNKSGELSSVSSGDKIRSNTFVVNELISKPIYKKSKRIKSNPPDKPIPELPPFAKAFKHTIPQEESNDKPKHKKNNSSSNNYNIDSPQLMRRHTEKSPKSPPKALKHRSIPSLSKNDSNSKSNKHGTSKDKINTSLLNRPYRKKSGKTQSLLISSKEKENFQNKYLSVSSKKNKEENVRKKSRHSRDKSLGQIISSLFPITSNKRKKSNSDNNNELSKSNDKTFNSVVGPLPDDDDDLPGENNKKEINEKLNKVFKKKKRHRILMSEIRTTHDIKNEIQKANTDRVWTLEDITIDVSSSSNVKEIRDAIILCHKTFCSSVELMKALRKRFINPKIIDPYYLNEENENDEKVEHKHSKNELSMFTFEEEMWKIRIRVANVIRYWIKYYWKQDFKNNKLLQNELGSFLKDINDHIKDDNKMTNLLSKIHLTITAVKGNDVLGVNNYINNNNSNNNTLKIKRNKLTFDTVNSSTLELTPQSSYRSHSKNKSIKNRLKPQKMNKNLPSLPMSSENNSTPCYQIAVDDDDEEDDNIFSDLEEIDDNDDFKIDINVLKEKFNSLQSNNSNVSVSTSYTVSKSNDIPSELYSNSINGKRSLNMSNTNSNNMTIPEDKNNSINNNIDLAIPSNVISINYDNNGNEILYVDNASLRFPYLLKSNLVDNSEDSSQSLMSLDIDLMTLDCEDIAEQLTFMDFYLYKKIKARECIDQCWKKKGNLKWLLSPNILRIIQNSNTITKWVQMVIIQSPSNKIRSVYIKKFIKILKSLKELRNFCGLVAVYSGLNSSMIQNFANSWKLISNSKKRVYNNIKQLFGWKMKELKLLQEETLSPTIPHIGLYLQMLFNIEEMNKLYRNKNNINYINIILLSSKIDEFLLFQNSNYFKSIEPNYTVQRLLLKEFLIYEKINDETIYKLAQTAQKYQTKN